MSSAIEQNVNVLIIEQIISLVPNFPFPANLISLRFKFIRFGKRAPWVGAHTFHLNQRGFDSCEVGARELFGITD